MLDILARVKGELPELLIDADAWQSFYINYHPPTVERLWRQWGEYRVYLHKIYPCEPEKALFHPHPWPSAMEVISGRYEMTIGYGEGNNPPPVAAKVVLVAGSTYEMTEINGWHAVRPLNKPSLSLMVTGPPWNRWSPSGEIKPGPLTGSEKIILLNHFRHRLGYKHNALSHDMIEVARHTGEILDYYSATAHVVKCDRCKKRLSEMFTNRRFRVGNNWL